MQILFVVEERESPQQKMWFEAITITVLGLFFIWGTITLFLQYQTKKQRQAFDSKKNMGVVATPKPITEIPTTKEQPEDEHAKYKPLPSMTQQPTIDVEEIRKEILKDL